MFLYPSIHPTAVDTSTAVAAGAGAGPSALGTPGAVGKTCRIFLSCESKYRGLGVAIAAALRTYGHEVAFSADAIARGTAGFSEVRGVPRVQPYISPY